jgi:biopolymer transport protein ExbB
MAQIGAEWVLYLLVILSLVSVALMIERGIFFWRARFDLDLTRLKLHKLLKRGGPLDALNHFRQERGIPSAMLCEALEVAHDGASAVEERAAGARGKYKMQLERGLIFLGTLGNNAPFIGLFGTVLGIINAFRDLSHVQLQLAGPRIMGSISEALVATAVGLLVAIPAVIAFNVFQRRVKQVITDSDVLLHDLLAYLRGQEAAELTFSAPEVISAKALSISTNSPFRPSDSGA